MKDFFVSYNVNDRSWAEWIAWQLEENGFTVIVQAWDFVGNWVLKMDHAMRESQRTIAVLSPHYVQVLYTHAEWANAFRLDPTGERDLLIPVRVVPVELSGTLAQLVYLDVVGRKEDEAREMLLKRVRGERGKPATSPNFPGASNPTADPTKRSIAQKPSYPAAAEDEEKARRVAEIIVRWRGLYAHKVDVLRNAAEKARAWRKEPPTAPDNEVVAVIALAGEAARDLQALPLRELEFATSYGLRVHQTVFWGQATATALSQASFIEPETLSVMQKAGEMRSALGLPAVSAIPNESGFEMLERVLNAALSLAIYNIAKLPRGYVENIRKPIPSDLRAHECLLVAKFDDDPGLHLVAVNSGIERLGYVVARNLELYLACAKRNRQGTVDLVGWDNQHIYYWQESASSPTMQFPKPNPILGIRFLSDTPGAEVATVDFNGKISVIRADGGYRVARQPIQGERFEDAKVWIDPLDPADWYVIAITRNSLMSGLHGTFSTTRSSEDLWNDNVFLSEFEYWFGGLVRWTSMGGLTFGTLDGLPCLIVERSADWGSGIHFLHPKTLTPLRRPLAIRDHVAQMTLVAERWLLVTLRQEGPEVRNRIVMWDLDAPERKPEGSGFEGKGDVYYPTIVRESPGESFQTIQVFANFESPSDRRDTLFLFSWPSGKIEVLERYSVIRIWPVAEGSRP